MTELDLVSQQRRARGILLLIAGIPAAIMLAATVLWWLVEAGHVDLRSQFGTANHGDLLNPPRSVSGIAFRHDGVAELLWKDLPVKWRLLVVQRGATCDTICEAQLYQTRQIHLALGKDFNRVGRVLLSDTSPADTLFAGDGMAEPSTARSNFFPEWLAREHQSLTPLTLPTSRLDELVPETRALPSQWYVVDPAGWIMMSVSDDLHYKDVISDLRFLLKHSGA